MNIKPRFIVKCFIGAVSYIPTTLLITAAVVVIGLLLGVLVAALRTYRKPPFAQLADIYVVVFKAIPVNLVIILASLFFAAYFERITQFFHLGLNIRDVNRAYIGIFALSFLSVAQISEFIRGALLSIDQGQYEAGYTVGMSFFQTFRRIVFPQMMLVFAPSLTGIVIALLKASSLVILLGVVDVLNGALIYANVSYCYFEAYLAAALVYWALNLLLQFLGKLLEKGLGRYRREIV
jgi:L-cystine transport system permease protein